MKLPTDTIPELMMVQNANNYSQWYCHVNTNHWRLFILVSMEAALALLKTGNIPAIGLSLIITLTAGSGKPAQRCS